VTALVELRGVEKTYGSGEATVHALTSADLSVRPGELLLIEGPSGSGKTTLLSILGLILRPSAGRILVGGEDVTGLTEAQLPHVRARTYGFVFQGFNLFPALSARENVMIAIRMKDPRGRDAAKKAARLLDLVGLGDRVDRRPAELSGGQQQRVAIARALAGDPPLLLGDEPTAALDSRTALHVMQLLRSLVTPTRGVALLTHDVRLQRFADRVVRIDDGRVDVAKITPLATLLGGIPLFAGLGQAVLADLANHCRERALGGGAYLSRAGEIPAGIFVVAEGTLEAVRTLPTGEESIIETVSRGTVVGELAILHGEPRATCLRSRGPTFGYELDGETFLQFAHRWPEVALAIARQAANRFVEAERQRSTY
jgi:putative ABC transport system ATP-binding protein